jgi:3-hydroxyacyl-CoA dehydrogenase
MPDRDPKNSFDSRSSVFLIGAGVVGRSILGAHLEAKVSVCLIDQDESAVSEAVNRLSLRGSDWKVSSLFSLGPELAAVDFVHQDDSVPKRPPIVIESIAERLDIKQSFFANAERLFGDDAVLCSNTSTLRIGDVASSLQRPERFCGMHFFMPVEQRHAVEVVRGEHTSEETINAVTRHANRIAKPPLVVGDGPGFIVNRLLSPYLNQAMLLLGMGVGAEQIERAAIAYGMPMSPLELIDLISTRTVFDAGRVFWQAFPGRIDPSPIAPALLKRKRMGRAEGGAFYDYSDDVRSEEVSPAAVEIVNRYLRDHVNLSDQEVIQLLSIPMWIEAALASRDGIASSPDQFETAMIGGLGFDSTKSWLDFFDSMGSPTILNATERWGSKTASMRLPDWIAELLNQVSPTEVLERSLNVKN